MILRQGEEERYHQSPKISDFIGWATDGTQRVSDSDKHGPRMEAAMFPRDS